MDNLEWLLWAIHETGGVPAQVRSGVCRGEAEVLHDSWCLGLVGGPCMCLPVVRAYGIEYSRPLFALLIHGVSNN